MEGKDVLTIIALMIGPVIVAVFTLCRKWVLHLVLLPNDLGSCRFAAHRARNGLLRGTIIVILYLVVARLPVNENTNTKEKIIGLI
jgi:hypothetical protein